jgi:predicted ArsR family transcriptional regulator
LSETSKISPEKAREMQERIKERSLIIQQIKSRGPSTVEELSKSIGMEKAKLFKHLVAMRQFGKVVVMGERDEQLIYGVLEKEETGS